MVLFRRLALKEIEEILGFFKDNPRSKTYTLQTTQGDYIQYNRDYITILERSLRNHRIAESLCLKCTSLQSVS